MRQIERSHDVEVRFGHPMSRKDGLFNVQVCGPATGRAHGRPSREPWPDERVVVIQAADDDTHDEFADVESITLPLSLLRDALGNADKEAHVG